MRDIEVFRANIEAVIETEKKRFKDPENAKKVIEFDLLWRNVLQEIQDLRKQRNDLSNKISQFKKSGEQEKANSAIEKSKQIKETIDALEKKKIEYLEER